MQYASINGIRLAYQDQGRGMPLLLIHGFPFSSVMWQPQIDGLAAHFRVIVPDLRGFGASEYGSGVTRLDDYAADLMALLDHLELSQVALGGLSMGGYIAFAFLRRDAARVQALLLADTKAGPDSEEAKQGREQNARLVETQGLAPLADQMLPKLLANSTSGEQHNAVRAIITANQPVGIAAALRAMAQRPDATPQLSAITAPTLVIVGSDDSLTPPSEARKMHHAIAGSRLVEIPAAAHLPNWEAPALFNAAVTNWLVAGKRAR